MLMIFALRLTIKFIYLPPLSAPSIQQFWKFNGRVPEPSSATLVLRDVELELFCRGLAHGTIGNTETA